MKGVITFTYRNFTPLVFKFNSRDQMLNLINHNKACMYFDVGYILPEECKPLKVKRGQALRVIDNNGEVYKSIRQAAFKYRICYRILSEMLAGKLKNTTTLRYLTRDDKLRIV